MMGQIGGSLDRAGHAVWLLRYGVRGWNAPQASPVSDVRWALDRHSRRGEAVHLAGEGDEADRDGGDRQRRHQCDKHRFHEPWHIGRFSNPNAIRRGH
jgi:hypothetical protein